MTEKEDELLTVQEVARRFGVHPITVHNWIKSGLLEAVATGSGNRLSTR